LWFSWNHRSNWREKARGKPQRTRCTGGMRVKGNIKWVVIRDEPGSMREKWGDSYLCSRRSMGREWKTNHLDVSKGKVSSFFQPFGYERVFEEHRRFTRPYTLSKRVGRTAPGQRERERNGEWERGWGTRSVRAARLDKEAETTVVSRKTRETGRLTAVIPHLYSDSRASDGGLY
jgi:hypothetical protein